MRGVQLVLEPFLYKCIFFKKTIFLKVANWIQFFFVQGEGAVAKHTKMVAVLSKLQISPSWLTSKGSGLVIAAVASGIIILWKKKLNEVSKKRLVTMNFLFELE